MGKSKELAELGNAVAQTNGTTAFKHDTLAIVSAQSGNAHLSNYAYASGWTYDLSTASVKHTIGTSSAAPTTFKTDNVERMTIDASGRVTMPYQAGFRAYLNTNYTHPSGQHNLSSAWGGLGYWSKSFDNQNNFSTSTGLFTAPVTGMYNFSAGLNGNSSSNNITYFSCEFLVNGSRKSIHWFGNIKSGSSGYSAANNASVFKLSAGDTVGLYCELNSSETLIGNSADAYSFFSGYLIG